MNQTDDQGAVRRLIRRAWVLVGAITLLMSIGTIGYRVIGGADFPWADCFYMTLITVTTIGYGEVLDFAAHPAGRWFTVFIIFFGVGTAAYLISMATSLAMDTGVRAVWRKRRMEKILAALKGHYIVCGWSGISTHIALELSKTHRPYVVIAPENKAPLLPDGTPPPLLLLGDPSDDDFLQRAGIARAEGVFATDADDQTNVVICVSARRLNATARIVAAVSDPRNTPKMRNAGANATVSPTAIGGLRMASEMVRPSVVTFLDTMLRDPTQQYRIEEVPVGAAAAGKSLQALNINVVGQSLLMALNRGGAWVFHPNMSDQVQKGDILVIMATSGMREKLEIQCGSSTEGLPL